jgi:O-antigen/teichoic acid export membrane protein
MSFRTIAFGTALISSVRLIRLLAQFVAIPILARLLTPAEYGLVAIAMPFVLFSMMLADAGIGMSLVRTLDNNKLAWSTSFWLSTLLGLVLGLIMAGFGPVAAAVFNEPQLTPMLIALSFVVLAQSIHLIPAAHLQKNNRFKTIACVELFATFSGLGTAVYMAYHGYGAWALIGQQIVYFAVRLVTSFCLSGYRPALIFRWSHVIEHVRFGRNVLGNGLVNYFSRSFDNWVVGKALGATMLGFYSMAFLFARLPAQMVTGPLQYVVYGQLAKINHDPEALGRAFLLLTRLLAAIIFPAMGMVAAAHDPVFTALLSDKWAYAGVIFMLLAPACALQAVVAVGETILFALGRTQVQLRTSVEFACIWIIALIAFVTFGLTSAALTYCVVTILYQIRYLSIILPMLHLRFHHYLRALMTPLIATGLSIAAYVVMRQVFDLGQWGLIGTCGALSIMAAAVTIALRQQQLMQEIRELDLHISSQHVAQRDL